MSRFCRGNDHDDKITFYLCHQNEKCCSEGCCTVHSNKIFQSWYIWLMVALIYLIFYLCSWCCKSIEKARKRRLQQSSSRNQSIQGSPRRVTEVRVDELLEYSCISNNRKFPKVGDKVLEPPPQYQEAVKMSKPQPDAQVIQIHFSDENSVATSAYSPIEVPPSYEDVTVKTKEKVINGKVDL